MSMLLVVGILALPSAASADLPKKPACSAVTAALLKSTFGFSFSIHSTSKRQHTKTLQHLECVYRGAEGDLSIEYNGYSSGKAARANFISVRASLIRQGKAEPSDTIVQLLPLITLRGIGDRAFRTDDGTVVEFVDGIDSVRIEHGFLLDTPARTIRGMVALAVHVDLFG